MKKLKWLKKMTEFIISIVMILSCFFGEAAFADDAVVGTCGDNLTWKWEGYCLTISGTGSMYNYDSSLSPFPFAVADAIYINDGVTTIGDYAFYGKETNGLSLPDTLISIGDYAFSNFTYQFRISIPEGVTTIGAYAFSGWSDGGSGLATLYLPSSITSIGEGAFKSSGFETIYCYKDTAADDANLYPDGAEIIYLDEEDSTETTTVDTEASTETTTDTSNSDTDDAEDDDTESGAAVEAADLNGDGDVSTRDAVIALQMAVGSKSNDLTADVNGDGKVTTKDAVIILQYAINKAAGL